MLPHIILNYYKKTFPQWSCRDEILKNGAKRNQSEIVQCRTQQKCLALVSHPAVCRGQQSSRTGVPTSAIIMETSVNWSGEHFLMTLASQKEFLFCLIKGETQVR